MPIRNDLTNSKIFLKSNIVGAEFGLTLADVNETLDSLITQRHAYLASPIFHRPGTLQSSNFWTISTLMRFLTELEDNVIPERLALDIPIQEKCVSGWSKLTSIYAQIGLPWWAKYFSTIRENDNEISIVFYIYEDSVGGTNGLIVKDSSVTINFDKNGKPCKGYAPYIKRVKEMCGQFENRNKDQTFLSIRDFLSYQTTFIRNLTSFFVFMVSGWSTGVLNSSNAQIRGVRRSDDDGQVNYTVLDSAFINYILNQAGRASIETREEERGHIEAYLYISKPYVVLSMKAKLYTEKSYSFDFFSFAGKTRLMTSPTESEDPIYGVELELSTDYTVREMVDALEPVWLCAKHDGSIRGSKANNHEMVTLPMTYSAHSKLWGQWFRKLDMRKFDTSYGTNNGMHIHVSREAFDNARHIRDFAWWFTTPQNSKFVIDFSGRGTLNGYCALPSIPLTSKRTVVRRDILRYIGGLRGVINLNKGATVEVRLFKGVVSYAAVMKNLDLVDAVFHLTRSGISYKKDPLSALLEYLESPAVGDNKYYALKESLKEMVDLNECLDFSLATNAMMGKLTVGEVLAFLDKQGTTFKTALGASTINDVFSVSTRNPTVAWNRKTGVIELKSMNPDHVSKHTKRTSNQVPIKSLEEKVMKKFGPSHQHTVQTH